MFDNNDTLLVTTRLLMSHRGLGPRFRAKFPKKSSRVNPGTPPSGQNNGRGSIGREGLRTFHRSWYPSPPETESLYLECSSGPGVSSCRASRRTNTLCSVGLWGFVVALTRHPRLYEREGIGPGLWSLGLTVGPVPWTACVADPSPKSVDVNYPVHPSSILVSFLRGRRSWSYLPLRLNHTPLPFVVVGEIG